MKQNKIYQKNNILLTSILIFFIIILIIYYTTEEYEDYKVSMKTRTLSKDGFAVLYNSKYALNTTHTPCYKLHNDVLNLLPQGYVFIDYIYEINNVALSTFHRDVTSSKYIYNTKHTVYTLILYKYDGELLSLCPGSNQTYPFVFSRIVNIDGKSGTAFLFECDVLHAGRINACKDRKVIQYKICHKDDLEKLKSLSGVYKKKTEQCIDNLYGKIKRKLSYFFEMPINYFAYPLMIKKENDNNITKLIQSFIPIDFYNND
jgi:hypothetical protein